MRHVEKRRHLIERLGANLRSQRLTVFREDCPAFAKRLALFGLADATPELVEALERGDGAVSIEAWMCAWQVMQVADAVAGASKSDAALFLAASRELPGIEEEMAAELNKADGKTGGSR